MKLYILDTDTLSLFERGHPQVTARFRQIPYHEIGITIITVEEQLRGRLARIRAVQTNRSSADEELEAYRWLRETVETLRDFAILDFDIGSRRIYQSLLQQKIRIGSQDLRVASIVLSVSGILVTRNSTHFGQIRGLVYEDWAK